MEIQLRFQQVVQPFRIKLFSYYIMEKYIKQFIEYLEVEKGLSRHTTDNYDFYLKRFAGFAKAAGVGAPCVMNAHSAIRLPALQP